MTYRLIRLLVLLFWFMTTVTLEQVSAQNSRKNDSLVQKKHHRIHKSQDYSYGLFAELSLENSPHPGGYQPVNGVNVGLNFEFISIGAFTKRFMGDLERRLIFPNYFLLDYGYGGAFLDTRFHKSELLEGHVRINYGQGDMIWKRSSTGEDFLRDQFTLIQPEMLIGFSPVSFFALYGTIGYRSLRELSLTSLKQQEFSGWYCGLGLRLGLYKE